MKRFAIAALLVLLALLSAWLVSKCRREPPAPPSPPTTGAECHQRAEERVAAWKAEGIEQAKIEALYQAELAKCSGMTDACAGFVGAANVDLAWLGRAVLSGSMQPAEYLGRVKDRTRKLRESRKAPAICDAYAAGDADGDLVPDADDTCPDTPSLERTDAKGCPDAAPLPPAPSAADVDKAAKALDIPVSRACVDAPRPGPASVTKAGLSPDGQSYLLVVTRAPNATAGCEVFYQVGIRMRNKSFFLQMNSNTVYTRVFRERQTITGPLAQPGAMTFELRKADATVPWRDLTFRAVEPGDISQRYFRVRTVNGNGLTNGWTAETRLAPSVFP